MHLVCLSKSRVSIDLQNRQMEREGGGHRQTGGNRIDRSHKRQTERQLDNEKRNYKKQERNSKTNYKKADIYFKQLLKIWAK